MPLPRADALGMGPPSFELDLQMDGSNSTTVYVTSDGLNGQLIVGKENLPFSIEPSRINMSSGDVNVPVGLTFYGNETLEPGVYEGKVTFLAMTGGFVAYGIKIRVKINLLGEAQEIQEEEPEMSVEEESEEEPEAEEEPESEEEPETIAEEEESEEEETEIESEEEPETIEEAQEFPKNNDLIVGGLAIGIAVVLGLIGIWWKRR